MIVTIVQIVTRRDKNLKRKPIENPNIKTYLLSELDISIISKKTLELLRIPVVKDVKRRNLAAWPARSKQLK